MPTLSRADVRAARLCRNAVMLALAMIFSFVEHLVPLTLLIPLPGVKLGLANVVITALFFLGSPLDALIVSTARIGLSALLFGMIFSLGWTPCVGAFLGSALMLASQQGHVVEGMLMLLAYSMGLGIPFLLSAVLIDYLKSAFNWIKRNYKTINLVSGGFLIIVGILMATGMLGRLLALLS